MITPRFVGAIDQGTTSTRFILFDAQGLPLTCVQREHRQIYPQPGWVEHDPREILSNTVQILDEAAEKTGLTSHDLAAIGITNQRETTVLWDKITGSPIHNALVWQDTRNTPQVQHLARTAAEDGTPAADRFRSITGLPLTTYFSGTKIQWLLEHIPGARASADRGELLFGTIDSYLLYHLTGGTNSGVHRTDVTNASRTQLMNLATLDWDPDLLRTFNIPASLLPEIRSSSEHFGVLQHSRFAGVPITGILGDQQAALVGQTCFKAGEVKNTYGTGCFLLMNTGDPKQSRHGLLTTVGYKLGSTPAVYALEGSIAIAGALVQWLRDNLGLIRDSAEVEQLALTVADNGGVYFVPAFSGLYAPHWKDSARGVIAGLTRFANRGHLARAVLEATAFQTREVVEAMEQDSGIALTELRADGGMVGNDLFLQFQADILNRRVLRPAIRETTALGAAYAAGLAVGFFRDLHQLAAQWQPDHAWYPAMDDAARDQTFRLWKKAVDRSLDWID